MLEVIRVTGLKTHFFTESTILKAVDGVDISIMPGETMGLVGESGCGKSMTALSIMRLIPSPPGRIVGGEVIFDDKDLLTIPEKEMRKLRGDHISMIFQEPMTSLNPVYTIGRQISEVFRYHRDMSRKEIRERAFDLLHQVGVTSIDITYNAFPHELSGGQRQRIMIAMALALSPALMIADEPTTALDVTIQASILELMADLKDERDMSILLITHDLGVVSEVAQRIAVMYAGRLVEMTDASELFVNPLHPYTRGLLQSLPSMSIGKKSLYTIPGTVPRLSDVPKGCSFHPRCPQAQDICSSEEPRMIDVETKGGNPHEVRCWLYG